MTGKPVEIQRVLVVGAGLMGSGIAQMAAMAKYQVALQDIQQEALDKALDEIVWSLGKFVQKGRITANEQKSALGRVSPTLKLEDASKADFVIEAVYEDKTLKREIFQELDRLCPSHTILASNTSAIPITELASVTNRADRVVGTHFFSPVPLMPLCELVRGLETSQETLAITQAFVESMEKETITVKRDVAGFALNRINIPSTIEAIRLVESGVVTPEDVDRGMRLGMGRRMGPFETMDMTGLDITLRAMSALHEETRDPRFWPPELLRRKVAAGQLGRKSGRGWYVYTEER